MAEINYKHIRDLFVKRQLVPFIGAGLSTPFNIPDWSYLVNQLSEEYVQDEIKPTISMYIKKNKYWEAMDLILEVSNTLEQDIQEEVVNIINNNKKKKVDESEHNYLDLGSMNFPLYLTTNYDHLLNDFLDDKTYQPQLLNEIQINVQNLINSTIGKRIIHLHGNISSTLSIVLTKSKYEELYNTEKYKEMFKALCSSKTFLFLGFSFDDQYIQWLIKEHKEMFNSSHYILLNNPDFKKIDELKSKYNLKVIPYNSNNSSHSQEIRNFLKEIQKDNDLNLHQDKLDNKLLENSSEEEKKN